jgi:hypothetical protein
MKITVLWDVTPCSLVDSHTRFGEIRCFHPSSTLKIEAKISSETLVPLCQTTWHHTSEDNNLQSPL